MNLAAFVYFSCEWWKNVKMNVFWITNDESPQFRDFKLWGFCFPYANSTKQIYYINSRTTLTQCIQEQHSHMGWIDIKYIFFLNWIYWAHCRCLYYYCWKPSRMIEALTISPKKNKKKWFEQNWTKTMNASKIIVPYRFRLKKDATHRIHK